MFLSDLAKEKSLKGFYVVMHYEKPGIFMVNEGGAAVGFTPTCIPVFLLKAEALQLKGLLDADDGVVRDYKVVEVSEICGFDYVILNPLHPEVTASIVLKDDGYASLKDFLSNYVRDCRVDLKSAKVDLRVIAKDNARHMAETLRKNVEALKNGQAAIIEAEKIEAKAKALAAKLLAPAKKKKTVKVKIKKRKAAKRKGRLDRVETPRKSPPLKKAASVRRRK